MAAQSRNIAELENASVWRLLIQYSLPSIAGMVVYSLYNIIDSVFIGHGVGPLALSGLAVTFPIMNLTFALGTLVGIGGAAISSIRLGRKDQEGTERTLGKETTPREMKDQIIKLLDDWKGQQKEHEKPEKKNEQEK